MKSIAKYKSLTPNDKFNSMLETSDKTPLIHKKINTILYQKNNSTSPKALIYLYENYLSKNHK